MQPSTQYSTGTCSDCGAPTVVTPDPYGDGSPFEFAIACTTSEHHRYIKSYAHDKPAPVFTIAAPKEPRSPRPRRTIPPPQPLTPAQASLLALLLKG